MGLKDIFSKKPAKVDEDCTDWLRDNETKRNTCHNCMYKGTYPNDEICMLTKEPVVREINGITYAVRWNVCNGYKLRKSCDNCDNKKVCEIVIADIKMEIAYCPYEFNECKTWNMWTERKVDKPELAQTEEISEEEKDEIDKFIESVRKDEDERDEVKPIAKPEPEVDELEDEPLEEPVKEEKPVVEPEKKEEKPDRDDNLESNPVISNMVSEISTTMRDDEIKAQTKVPEEVIQQKRDEEENAMHEEHINSLLDGIASGKGLPTEQIEVKPEPEPITTDTEIINDEEDKSNWIDYSQYEQLPGESRRKFKKRIRKELGLTKE